MWCFHPNFPGMMQVPVLQYHVQCGLQRQFLPCDQQLAQTEEEPAIAAVQRLDAFTPKQVTPAGLRTLWCRQRMHPLSGSCPATPAWLRAEHLAGHAHGASRTDNALLRSFIIRLLRWHSCPAPNSHFAERQV